MTDQPIIQSLADTDLYKFSMQQLFLHRYPAASAEHLFHCRNSGIKLGYLAPEVNEQVDHLCSLQFSPDELAFLGRLPWLTPDYIEFLRLFRLNRDYISIEDRAGDLVIKTCRSLVHNMPFELYVLPIVNELYFRRHREADWQQIFEKRLAAKIVQVQTDPRAKGFRFADFGGRRRFSRQVHREVVSRLSSELPEHFFGTSNVALAMEFGLKAIGTMAHEYLQAFQQLGPRLADFQKVALDTWAQEYRGDLGIALTDVVGMDSFCRDLDRYLAKLFDGFRHDSGDPYLWTEKLIARLQQLGVDPLTKTAVYSDSLTIDKALGLHDAFRGRILNSAGIGTNLTNDCGSTPLNIVMKLVSCNDRPVAKLSDSSGKCMCDDTTFLAWLAKVHGVELNNNGGAA